MRIWQTPAGVRHFKDWRRTIAGCPGRRERSDPADDSARAPATGRLIRELQLRTKTGASIVGIERSGRNIINPGPDEELHEGDRVLLLGSRAQLDAAKLALAPPGRSPRHRS